MYWTSYCGKSFEQLDCKARQRRIMFVVNILGQNNNEVVAVTTVLCQSLLQRGHNIGQRLQADDVVCDREGQFDRLDQGLTRTLRATAGQNQKEEKEKLILHHQTSQHNECRSNNEKNYTSSECSPAGLCSQDQIYCVHSNSHDVDDSLSSLSVCQAVDAQRLQGGGAASREIRVHQQLFK